MYNKKYSIKDLLKIIKVFDNKINKTTHISQSKIVDYLYRERSNIIKLFLEKNNIVILPQRKKVGLKYYENLYFVKGSNIKLNDIKVLRKVGVLGSGQEYYIKIISDTEICVVDWEYH